MTLYELLLVFHVIAAIIWLGAGFIFLVLITLARRANEAEREASYHADIDRLAPVVFIPASLATFILGVLTAIEGNLDFSQAWLVIGLAGWLFSFLVGIAYFKPESARIIELDQQGPAGQAEAMIRSARMTAVDRFQVATLYTVVAAMVLKPTGDDPGTLTALAAIVGLVALLNAGALRGSAVAP